jgi:4-amino-4-deoxychorismate lyase
VKLASQPLLAGLKHGNRLEQLMARRSWQDGWHEAIVCDYAESVIEATQSNVFIVKNNVIKTPVLSQCGVAGVMREYVIEQAQKLGFEVQIVSLSVAELSQADEVFVTNSIIGLWPVKQFQQIEFTHFNISNTLLKSIINNEVISNF